MADAVLDASALLAVLNGETGADIVVAHLDDAIISTVNYAEVISKLVERGASSEEADAALRILDVQTVDFDIALARRTGALRAPTRSRGLSLADRACLALAERESRLALTADRNWVGIVAGVDVRLIR